MAEAACFNYVYTIHINVSMNDAYFFAVFTSCHIEDKSQNQHASH